MRGDAREDTLLHEGVEVQEHRLRLVVGRSLQAHSGADKLAATGEPFGQQCEATAAFGIFMS